MIVQTRFRAMAQRVVNHFAQPALLRQTVSTFDPATGVATPTHTDTPVTAHLAAYDERLVDGTRILAGDRKTVLAANGLAIVPKVGDTFIAGDEAATAPMFSVVDVQAKTVGLTIVSYELRVRR